MDLTTTEPGQYTVLSEALERMLLTRFLAEKNPKLPKALNDFTRDSTPDSVNNSLFESLTVILHQYKDYRNEGRCGKFGKTVQFWLLYMDLCVIKLLPTQPSKKTIYICSFLLGKLLSLCTLQ